MDAPQSSDPESRQPSDGDHLPRRRVTMNQVVARNIAYFRNALTLTQEELGGRLERITGKKWSKATMSAAERSWHGNRIRSFDADDLMALSQALEVPVTALLLPPEEDGTVIDYTFVNVGSAPYRDRTVKGGGTGAELLAQLFASEYDYMIGGDAFLERLQEALDFYYGAVPEDFFITRPQEPIDEHVALDEHVTKIRRQIATLREVMATLDRAASKLEGPVSDGDQADGE
ncbi:helix-turn-helix domain-containing protein [Streptomyces olivaceus]